MKYLCVKKCFWNNTLYEKGDTVDLNEKVKVPEHFKPCGTPQPQAAAPLTGGTRSGGEEGNHPPQGVAKKGKK